MASPIAQDPRLLLFAVLGVLTVLSAPVLLALHLFLYPKLRPGGWMLIEVGLWAIALTALGAMLFRLLGLTAFLMALGLCCIITAIVAGTTGGLELLRSIYVYGDYIPRYYVATSVVVAAFMLIAWEVTYRLKIQSSIRFVMTLTLSALIVVGLPGYLLLF